jgi:hypothetical protein
MTENGVAQNMAFAEDDSAGNSRTIVSPMCELPTSALSLILLLNLLYVKVTC